MDLVCERTDSDRQRELFGIGHVHRMQPLLSCRRDQSFERDTTLLSVQALLIARQFERLSDSKGLDL